MRRLALAALLAVALAGCGGSPKDAVAETCRRINRLAEAPDKSGHLEAIPRSAAPELARILDDISRASKAAAAVAPMSRLQVECAFAGVSLA